MQKKLVSIAFSMGLVVVGCGPKASEPDSTTKQNTSAGDKSGNQSSFAQIVFVYNN